MKTKYTIFYSWQNDTDGNRSYIRTVLEDAVKKISESMCIEIQIDSDSRDEDGGKPIDEAIIGKIQRCDFFLADVTPVHTLNPGEEVYKSIPNPNVMLELGYAIHSVGWERCILVWNTKCGAQQNSPFDIRNHITKTFEYTKEMSTQELKKTGLQLKSIIQGKIDRYDVIIAKQKSNDAKYYDYSVYKYWDSIASFDMLKSSIDGFCSNIGFHDKDLEIWDRLYMEYTTSFNHRFLNEELTVKYEQWLSALRELSMFAATYCDKLQDDRDYYKLRNFYRIMDPDKAAEEEHNCIKKVIELHAKTLERLKEYRRTVAEAFHE